MDLSVHGWNFNVNGKPVAPDIRDLSGQSYYPAELLHSRFTPDRGVVHYQVKFTALRDRLSESCDCEVLHDTSLEADTVSVNGRIYPRSRLRACCNPCIYDAGDRTYLMVNTAPGVMTEYDVDTGETVRKLNAPDYMTAIYLDEDRDKLHLLGWYWGPHEVSIKVPIIPASAPAQIVAGDRQ